MWNYISAIGHAVNLSFNCFNAYSIKKQGKQIEGLAEHTAFDLKGKKAKNIKAVGIAQDN